MAPGANEEREADNDPEGSLSALPTDSIPCIPLKDEPSAFDEDISTMWSTAPPSPVAKVSRSQASASGKEPWRNPSNEMMDQVAVLRTLQHLLRVIEALRIDPKHSLKHLESAKARAEAASCWPLLDLCSDLRAFAGSRRKVNNVAAAADWKREARRYREQSDIDDPGRWQHFTPRFNALRRKVLSSNGETTPIFQRDPPESNLAQRRGKPKEPLQILPNRRISRSDYTLSTASQLTGESARPTFDTELGSAPDTPSTACSWDLSPGPAEPSPVRSELKAPPKTPISIATPNLPYRKYSRSGSSLKQEVSGTDAPRPSATPNADVPTTPLGSASATNGHSKSPTSPITKFPASRVTERSVVASSQTSRGQSLGAARAKRRKKSVHVQAWEHPNA